MDRKVPDSRLKELQESWAAYQDAIGLVEEAIVERDRTAVAHRKKIRAILKEQGAPVTHFVDLDTGEIFDPAKRAVQATQAVQGAR